MKIDRVLFCLNNNNIYTDFWNINSKIYKLCFNITPTLIYVGNEEDIKKLNLSKEFGEIFILPSLDISVSKTRDWYITWGLFYGATLFQEDVCMTSGIDQIPLSDIFFKKISNIDKEKYIVGFADAYYKNNLFPSSHHVSKGKFFKEIYKIEDDWEKEVLKVFNKKKCYDPRFVNPIDFWGLDESYSSEHLIKNNNVVYINNFFHTIWQPGRLDRDFNLNYDIKKLSEGVYTELHCPRPYKDNKPYIDLLVNNLINLRRRNASYY